MIPAKQVINGIAKYIDNEILIKMPKKSLSYIGLAAMATIGLKRCEGILDCLKNMPLLTYMNVIDQDNNIDVDLIKSSIKENMDDSGVELTLPIINVTMTLYKKDIDRIHDYINGGSNVTRDDREAQG